MPTKLELAEAKWARNTPAARAFWAEKIRAAESLDAYVKGVADITGLSEAEVRAALPTTNWAHFQSNVDQYLNVWMEGIARAAREHKWSKGYIGAYKRRE